MRSVVADELERFRVGASDELDRGVGRDRVGEVGEAAVEAHGDGALGERRRNRLRDVETGGAALDLALGAVRKCQGDFGHVIPPLTLCIPSR